MSDRDLIPIVKAVVEERHQVIPHVIGAFMMGEGRIQLFTIKAGIEAHERYPVFAVTPRAA
jgi:hypothetical protein